MTRSLCAMVLPIVAAALLFGSPALMAPAPSAPAQAPPPAAESVLMAGETLHFAISWRLFSAGEARIYLEHQLEHPAGSPAVKPLGWQATVRAISGGFVSRLYQVDDTFISRFEAGPGCSQSLVKMVHESRRHREIRIEFQKERKVAVLRETDLVKNQLARQAENAIPECAYDVVSALFHVRQRPLELGKSFQIQINDGSKTLPITIEVQAREEVKTPAGSFRTIRLEPKVFGGTLFRRSGRMQLWLTDDPRRQLVQLKARLFWGTINAVLQRAERMEHPVVAPSGAPGRE